MNFYRFPALCAIVCFAFLTNGRAEVEASLVASETSIQPGHAFTVALRLAHPPHWHTYWINPGTGLPTTITWQLPSGFTAKEIRWPAPTVLTDAATRKVVGNGYEGELLLPVEIVPDATVAPGSRVVLKADAEWLMCYDSCMPGSASLELELPISNEPPQPDPQWHEKIENTVKDLPRALPAWTVAASSDAKTVTLSIKPASGSGTHAPRDLHFFSDDNFVGYELPQEVVPDGKGGFTLRLGISPESKSKSARLLGVLTSSNGWQADGTMRGLLIDTPFANAAKPAAAAAASTETKALAPMLLLAFLGGLILNLMPCVFPVLGIKILGLVQQTGSDRRQIVGHGITYTAGVLVSFWILAGMLAILRAGGSQLGWGFQLQSPGFVFGLAVMLLGFGLNLSGVFEFGLNATSIGSGLMTKQGHSGSFFTGVLATVAATPCSAPFLAPALGAALALPTSTSFVVFTTIALGLATPYLLLSVFPSAVRALPRPGNWMETFRQFMAFPLYATTGYLVWVLAGQTSDTGFLEALFGMVLAAMAVWLYGRSQAPKSKNPRFCVAAAVVVLAAGVWLGWPRAASDDAVVWEPWNAERVTQLRAEGRIVYIDFTARWCATCQTNKHLVFGSSEVRRAFAAKKVAALRGDWTNRDPRITAELARWGRAAVPFNLIYMPGRAEPILLPELLTPNIVLDALETPQGQ